MVSSAQSADDDCLSLKKPHLAASPWPKLGYCLAIAHRPPSLILLSQIVLFPKVTCRQQLSYLLNPNPPLVGIGGATG